jgi:hypothetical protein
VIQAAQGFPPEDSLYIVSSKSGGTAEVMAMFEYFWEISGGDGSRFIAITDPGSPLEKLARERGFHKVFNADPQVGGRYSALTTFGLLPAALMGVDIRRLLARAEWMMEECFAPSGNEKHSRRVASRNPGLALGAVIGQAALAGLDKLTVLADAPLATFGSWLEQLIAESSGKQGKGIIPVDLEPLGDASVYGNDRLFVYLRQTGAYDDSLTGLRRAGQPVLVIDVPTTYDLGAEFYRWEVATAVACHILGVNAFDQPNVEDAKKRAKTRIAAYQSSGQLEAGKFVPVQDAGAALKKFLESSNDGNYIAIMGFLPRNKEMISALQDLRTAIRNKTNCAVTLGFGPRFLHSTGQLHKGGVEDGLFLQITADALEDVSIPSQGLTFGTLELAQALGDYEALEANGRKVLRVHLSRLDEVQKIVEILKE